MSTIVMSVNAGSSSLKFRVFKMPEEEVLATGNVERIGLEDAIFGMETNDEKIKDVLPIPDHAQAVKKLMEELVEKNVVAQLEDIKAMGHRVVQGGPYFSCSVPVDEDSEAKVEELCDLAPLHNPAALVGLRSFR
ncbi:MAG: acetate kinase, partial [Erysipelotrichaceae bacterium]|nr:acetate kinase [Erysipelotrichaceae bacterium]